MTMAATNPTAETIRGYEIAIDNARNYVRENVEIDELKLDDFCAEHDYSRRHVQRALAWVGSSWRRELTLARMKRATELLRTTTIPVAEVGRKVGYKQGGHFSKTFKRECGVAPSQYRRDVRARV